MSISRNEGTSPQSTGTNYDQNMLLLMEKLHKCIFTSCKTHCNSVTETFHADGVVGTCYEAACLKIYQINGIFLLSVPH